MENPAQRIHTILDRISRAEQRFSRTPGSVQLLAVSKTRPAEDLREAFTAGQRRFGESYLQEALEKIRLLQPLDIEWHFIGPIQSNKTRPIAEHFHWVHSVDRLKIAQRLSEQRPEGLQELQICIQVNTSGETSKSGCSPDAVKELAQAIQALPRLRLRGLMTIPAPEEDFEKQRVPFRQLHHLMEELNRSGLSLDTLSMGMSDDMEAAIAEGATIVRIGTAMFGIRE